MIRRRDEYRHPGEYRRRGGLHQADLRRVDRRHPADSRPDHYPVGFQRLLRADRQASANYRSSAEYLGAVRPID